MYTQCSKCETVFKLSAEVLRAAGGQVRCGRCGEVFNALARLAEDSTGFSAGESPLELEARADSILESIAPPQAPETAATDDEEYVPPGVEIAQLEVLDWTEEDQAQHEDVDAANADRSMEFTLPPGELDRIFIESKIRTPLVPLPQQAPPQQQDPTPQAPPQQAPAPTTTPSSQRAPTQQAPPEERVPPPAQQRQPPRPAPAPPEARVEPEPHPESADVGTLGAGDRVTGFEVPEDVRRDILAGFEPRMQLELELSGSGRRIDRRRLILWLSAAAVSALLLIAQVMHQNRDWLIAHGPYGAGVRALYGAMGAALPSPASLSAYQLRQWGVTGDPEANGILKVRASILNAAAQLQPYPLLRVTLADRFGKSIGARDFEPTEYMGKPTARLLAPGERVDATLEILDPGKNAEGFEIDVCLRGADQKISCANDVAPQAKR